MTSSVSVSRLRDQIAAARRRVSGAEGERKILDARRDRLKRDVGLAKGRLEHKTSIDRFLEELQAEAHVRRVGDFERLLTALVSEVLPGEPPVALNLEIERGQPSLDIVSRRGLELSEDIYDDQGGALTNVVSMGLRLIAAVRSKTRRFLILDESDCWIATNRVPAFYKVLKDAARQVDVQCLAISHHDVTTFEEGITVARLIGDKETGVMIENAPLRTEWKDQDDGIRWIRLRNFQTFIDETLHLSPGLNALTGRNNLGKSAVARAFRAVFYGEARDALIRHGERSCTIEIGFGNGRVLHWNRQSRRNPVNVWKWLDQNGSVVSEDGMTYESGGRTPPEWVAQIFGIGPVEGLDIHVNKQKSPVFLLDKPGSTRAAVLSVGQESGHIRAMIALHKERCTQDTVCVRDGEREMAVLLPRLEKLAELDRLSSRIEKAANMLDAIDQRAKDSEKLSEIANKLADLSRRQETLIRRSAALDRAPSADIDCLLRAETKNERLREIADRMELMTRQGARARKVRDVLKRLPDEMPSVTSTERLVTIADRLERSMAREARAAMAAAVLKDLPNDVPEIRRSDDLIRVGRIIREKTLKLDLIRRKSSVLSRVPDDLPPLRNTQALEELAAALDGQDRRGEQLSKEKNELDAETAKYEAELKQIADEMGGLCPVCGAGIDDPHVLVGERGHNHNQGGAAR